MPRIMKVYSKMFSSNVIKFISIPIPGTSSPFFTLNVCDLKKILNLIISLSMLDGLQGVPIAMRTRVSVLNMTNMHLYYLAHFYIFHLILHLLLSEFYHIAFFQKLSSLCSFSYQSLCAFYSFNVECPSCSAS